MILKQIRESPYLRFLLVAFEIFKETMLLLKGYKIVSGDSCVLNLNEINEIFRRALIKMYFEPELIKLGYRKSDVKHPTISDDGLTSNNFLHLYFDIKTGSDYPDGDEWFMVEYLFPYSVKLPDKIKGPDYFTTVSLEDGKNYWRHRELIRYKYGKAKKLSEALEFVDKKYKELRNTLEESSVTNKLS